MSFIEFVGFGVGALVLIYLVVRLASAAFFKSKQQYERGTHHE